MQMLQIQKMIAEVITENRALDAGFLFRDDFQFAPMQTANIFDAIVVKVPRDASSFSPRYPAARRSLQDCISAIRQYGLTKAIVIAEDLSFLHDCPSLTDLIVIPADTVRPPFDFEPLYGMPNLRYLECWLMREDKQQPFGTVDYARLQNLSEVVVEGKGHSNITNLKKLRSFQASDYRGVNKTLADYPSGDLLEHLSLTSCNLRSLDGIEKSPNIKDLELTYNRSLADISALYKVADSLRALSVEACGKIQDFSVLHALTNLEHLHLDGSTHLPDISFLANMPRLKTFATTMPIADGDLRPCLAIPYASVRNRKHHNLKDSDLSKRL